MVKRHFWISRLEEELNRRSIVWLCGVRRSGKTFLSKSLDCIEYFDCELPRVREKMADPEAFLSSLKGKRLVLDEVHRLPDPSELLKIAADHYPSVKIVATGSSSLEASARFRDTLTGRKLQLWLTPMNWEDLKDFGCKDFSHRLLRGGLPPFYLSPDYPEKEYGEWLDSYWARDVQDLFRLEKRASFMKFAELLFVQTGGIFEAARFAAPCEISRSTVGNYLAVLEATGVVHIVRPFSSRLQTEIVAAPKTYAFDTGFICHFKGWTILRNDDMGLLWEHFVLNEICGVLGSSAIKYWRDKSGHEIDFIIDRRGKKPVAVECKWRAAGLDATNLAAFNKIYPESEKWVVSSDIDDGFEKTLRGIRVRFCGLKELKKHLM